MAIHTQLYHELYKYTNHCKTEEMKKYLARFKFNEPSVNSDGLNFIDSVCLHTVDSEKLKNTRVYFENISAPHNRFMNKQIRVCNIPLSKLPVKRNVLNSLNKYLLSNIKVENNIYSCDSIESLGLRKSNWNRNYPDLEYIYKVGNSKNRAETTTKYIYGLQFNSIEFFNATGLLVTVFRSCKCKRINTTEENSYKMISKLSNFNELNDGLNIRISMQTDGDLEIDFTDTLVAESGYELYDYEYEINIASCVDSIEKVNSLISSDPHTISFGYDSKDYGIINNAVSNNVKYSEVIHLNEIVNFKYSNSIISSNDLTFMVDWNPYNSWSYPIAYSTDDSQSIKWSEILDNKKFNFHEISDTSWLVYPDENELEQMLTYCNRFGYTSWIQVYSIIPVDDNPTYELFDVIGDSDIVKYYEPTGDVINDENNIVRSLPFVLKNLLEENTTLKIEKINKLLASTITLYNNIPCVKYSIDCKHDSIMFFKGNKLLSPRFIEDSGLVTNIYIDLETLTPITNSINMILYNKDTTTKFINIDCDDFYIVYDTEKLFIENMRYDVKSIYKYLDLSEVTRYSFDPHTTEYNESPDGAFIYIDDQYLEIADGEYYLVNNKYTNIRPIQYNGKVYIKIKTNEYLLPLNKDIDPNKLVISIEDNVDYDDTETKYKRDQSGVYIYSPDYRYYKCNNFDPLSESFYYKLSNNNYVLYDDYIKDPNYNILSDERYYRDYDLYYNSSIVYILVDNEYYLYNDYVQIIDGIVMESTTGTYEAYNGNFYLRYGDGFFIPPYYYEEDIRYIKTGNRLVQLSNAFNLTVSDNIVAMDSYNHMKDENDKNIIVENKLYTKKELIHDIILKKYDVDLDSTTTTYYLSDNSYKIFNSNTYIGNIPILYYKTNTNNYVRTDIVNSTKNEISQFVNMNKVYKFRLVDGEILDGGLADTIDYIRYIDFGKELSFTKYTPLTEEEVKSAMLSGDTLYINIDDNLVVYNSDIHSSYDGDFYNEDSFVDGGTDLNKNRDINNELITDDDYPIYDFNFSSPYAIDDANIKAYRIDSSYSKYFVNDEDSFLAYEIPNQLINSESRMLTFLNGIMTDEYVINKKLFSRLFNGDTILSFSTDPIDTTGNSYYYNIDRNGEYYYNSTTKTYEYDPDRDRNLLKKSSGNTYYKISDSEYIECRIYDANDIVSTDLYIKNGDSYNLYLGTDIRTDLYYKLKNDKCVSYSSYVKNPDIIDYTKYFELKNEYNDSYFITTRDYYDYTISYSKSISTVFMTNMKNMTLYQNHNGITYDSNSNMFFVGNTIDTFVRNERQLYKDIFLIPLSTKYMLFFINGRFANPDIEISTPTTFYIKNGTDMSIYGEEINQIQIYVYDKFFSSLNKYKDAFFTHNTDSNIYSYNDILISDYYDNIKNSVNSLSVVYNPIDISSPNSFTNFVSLYEIFGKYVLNKYDIDSDPTLYNEIREYFSELFDEDNRMKLELIQDSSKRKYIY